MARKADYSDTQKFSNRKSFDGKPVPNGKVLVPFWKESYRLQKGTYIQENFTTMHLGEFHYEIGFMTVDEDKFASYMQTFWGEINEDMKMRREGRCIIGKNADGTNRLCPYTRRCKGCPNKGLLERNNPNRIELLSLDYEYDGDTFDIQDENQPSVEEQVLDKICPPPSEEEIKEKMLAYFDRENPRYAQIIRLSLQRKSIDDICIEIHLKSSRGRQEINNAYNAVCEYLRLRHSKKDRK